jgi:hypothetical protein
VTDDDRGWREQLVKMVVYAPLGAAALAREQLPPILERLIARGRHEAEETRSALENQLTLIRGLGRAVGRAVADRYLRPGRPTQQPTPEKVGDGESDGESAIRRAQREVGRTLQGNGQAPANEDATATPAGLGEVSEHQAAVAEAQAEAASLAIPDYETLSAAQVNARLGALRRDELTAIKAYEQSHRARHTILARIEALSS